MIHLPFLVLDRELRKYNFLARRLLQQNDAPMTSKITGLTFKGFCLSLALLTPQPSQANYTRNPAHLQLSNNMSCEEAGSKLNTLATDANSRFTSGAYDDFKSGESVLLNIPAEDLIGLKQVSGSYVVGPNSSIRLSDGKIVYRASSNESLREAVSRYLLKQYNYKYFTLSSTSAPTLDYSLRGEIPLQAYLTTKRSKGSSESSDLQVVSETIPNDLFELLKTRRLFTAYSDLSCIYVLRRNTRSVNRFDLSDLVFGSGGTGYIPLYNNDLIYIPSRGQQLDLDEARLFAQSQYASDVQISVTGSGAEPKVLLATSGTSLFEILANSNVLKKGFSSKIAVYRYNSELKVFDRLSVQYPAGAMRFVAKDKDIISVGRDPWSQSLVTLNEVSSPIISALGTFFFLQGIAF